MSGTLGGAEGTRESDSKKAEKYSDDRHPKDLGGAASDKIGEAASELLPAKAANSLDALLTADEKRFVTTDNVENGAMLKAASESPIEAIVNQPLRFGGIEKQMTKEEEAEQEKVEEQENERIKETQRYGQEEMLAANNIEELDSLRTLQMTGSEIASDISQSIEHQYKENPEVRTAAQLQDENLQVGDTGLTDFDRRLLLESLTHEMIEYYGMVAQAAKILEETRKKKFVSFK